MVLQVEHLKAEKSRTSKYHKKEKVAYVKTNEYLLDLGDEYVKESKVNVIELKPGLPYICKWLNPLNWKNTFKPNKYDKFITKIYTFNITK